MFKREKDDVFEKSNTRNFCTKVQKSGEFCDNSSEELNGYGSQESGHNSFNGKKKHKSQIPVNLSSDLHCVTYPDLNRIKQDLIPILEDDKNRILVRVFPEHLAEFNRANGKFRHIWGTDYYTGDSDIIAMLTHCGYLNGLVGMSLSQVAEIQVLLEISSPKNAYPATSRNGVKSRVWNDNIGGCTLQILLANLFNKAGVGEALQPNDTKQYLEPTFMPSQSERNISTRQSASISERRQWNYNDVTIQYNLNNEPWLRHSYCILADRGLKPMQLTSTRFQNEVLLVETSKERFELSLEIGSATFEPKYRFAIFNHLHPMSIIKRSGLPVSIPEDARLIADKLTWSDIRVDIIRSLNITKCLINCKESSFQFSNTGVEIEGKQYCLQRICFVERCSHSHAIKSCTNGIKK